MLHLTLQTLRFILCVNYLSVLAFLGTMRYICVVVLNI